MRSPRLELEVVPSPIFAGRWTVRVVGATAPGIASGDALARAGFQLGDRLVLVLADEPAVDDDAEENRRAP